MARMRSIIQGDLPVFDDKMFDEWKIKMFVVFGFQDVAKIIQDSVGQLISSKASEEEKKHFKQQQKLDNNARFLSYQCISSNIFNKI